MRASFTEKFHPVADISMVVSLLVTPIEFVTLFKVVHYSYINRCWLDSAPFLVMQVDILLVWMFRGSTYIYNVSFNDRRASVK